MLPLSLLFFQQFPLLSPLANLIAIPWVDCTGVAAESAGGAGGTLGKTVQTAVLDLAVLTLDGLWHIMVWLDRWPGMVLYRPAPPLWSLGFALPGIAVNP